MRYNYLYGCRYLLLKFRNQYSIVIIIYVWFIDIRLFVMRIGQILEFNNLFPTYKL